MGLVTYCVYIPSHAKRHYFCVCEFFVWEPYVASAQPCQIVCQPWCWVCVVLCSCLSTSELNLCDDAANTVTFQWIKSKIVPILVHNSIVVIFKMHLFYSTVLSRLMYYFPFFFLTRWVTVYWLEERERQRERSSILIKELTLVLAY